MPHMKEYVLTNLISLDMTQALGANEGRVREEVKRIANGGTHPP